ncbi:MAG: hypothetical protein ACYCTL_13080 [Acidimicrobiales bacterium]
MDALGGHGVHMGASVSVVMHLVEGALDQGRLVGEVEIVETGVRSTVRDADELLTFVQTHRPPPGPGQDEW